MPLDLGFLGFVLIRFELMSVNPQWPLTFSPCTNPRQRVERRPNGLSRARSCYALRELSVRFDRIFQYCELPTVAVDLCLDSVWKNEHGVRMSEVHLCDNGKRG